MLHRDENVTVENYLQRFEPLIHFPFNSIF